MASLRKRGNAWYYRYVDADGVKREVKGSTDKRATEQLARAAESEAAKIRAGLVDQKDLAYQRHGKAPLAAHLDDFESDMRARNDTPRHVRLRSDRARRVAALACGGRLADINPPKTASMAERARELAGRTALLTAAGLADLSASKVQNALGTLRAAERSLQILNHHRAAIRAFVLWARKDGRLRDDPLLGVVGFNSEEDRRHDRRTLSIEELRQLIVATEAAPPYREMTGPDRALCYRLAVASGLRYSEIGSFTPESFDLDRDHPSVTIQACYAKNGQTATLPLPPDLAADLGPSPLGTPGVPAPVRRRGGDAPGGPGPRRHRLPQRGGPRVRLPRPALPVRHAGRSDWGCPPGWPNA